MKKTIILFPLAVLSLMILSVSAWLTASIYQSLLWLQNAYWIVHLILPFHLMGLALLFHWRAKGHSGFYLLSYVCNAIGSGYLVGAIFGLRNYIPPAVLLITLLPAALICAGCIFIPKIANTLAKEIAVFTLFILGIALTVTGVLLWWRYSMALGCSLLFSGLFIIPFPWAVRKAGEKPEERMRYLSSSGFGAFILVSSVAVFILSDGEILDGLDISGSGGSKKKK